MVVRMMRVSLSSRAAESNCSFSVPVLIFCSSVRKIAYLSLSACILDGYHHKSRTYQEDM